jgi:hypothetical protein
VIHTFVGDKKFRKTGACLRIREASPLQIPMTTSAPMIIGCEEHGERASAVVCRHMLRGASAPAGFVENSSDPNDLQAWCSACEELYLHEGEMTDAFRKFNGMSIVCVNCYAEAKALHSAP